MYNRFFGFKERPFKLVPNPAYLFLSKSHQNALAHLVYAVDSGDGFVLAEDNKNAARTRDPRGALSPVEMEFQPGT